MGQLHAPRNISVTRYDRASLLRASTSSMHAAQRSLVVAFGT